jgi:hypothetical protein
VFDADCGGDPELVDEKPPRVGLGRMRVHAPLMITISLPSGSATRQRSSDSSMSRPPAPTVMAWRVCASSDGSRELEVDAVTLPAPLRLRSVELLEHQHRVQPPRIVDVGDPGSPVGGVSECGHPERADCGDVGGVEEELSEARQPRIRSGPEVAGSGLKVSGEVGEVELEAVGVVCPLVFTAVEYHESRAQVNQQREAGVVGQPRRCDGQVMLLPRRGGCGSTPSR